MSHPGTRRDHDAFCRREGWTVVRDARGREVGHHVTFEFDLPDGRILRTRVSRPTNNETYGPQLWATILNHQLEVSEDQFWACVHDKVLPVRGAPTRTVPRDALPASLVYQLVQAGFSEQAVAVMDKDEAVAAMTEHWSATRPSPRPRPG